MHSYEFMKIKKMVQVFIYQKYQKNYNKLFE